MNIVIASVLLTTTVTVTLNDAQMQQAVLDYVDRSEPCKIQEVTFKKVEDRVHQTDKPRFSLNGFVTYEPFVAKDFIFDAVLMTPEQVTRCQSRGRQ
jgi:hypothetical protein